MGRTKSDSPLKFPWDKIFSEDERQLDNAIEYCKSNSSGSENLKRAVTAIGYGYNSGSKSVLCERIREKAKQIRFQIDKADESIRDDLREQVIHFYRQTYLKKFEGKEEGIDNIRIPDRPDLPFLDENEKTMFKSVSPPSSPRGGSSGSKKGIIIEEDEEDEIIESKEDKLLKAEVIVYFKNAPIVGGKRSINGSEIYNIIKAKYTHPSMLDKDNVKRVIREVSGIFNTLTQGKIKEAEKLIAIKKEVKPRTEVNAKPLSSKKPVIIEEEEPEIEYEVKTPSQPVPKLVLPTSQVSSSKGLSENEVLHFIRKKGWPEPLIQSKESLCDYVLRKIRDEDEKSEGEYRGIREDIDRLSNNLIALTEMYENRLNEIEKIQKQQKRKKSVTWGENEIREYEVEKEEIKEQIEETKAQLEAAKEKEKEKEEVVEEKRQMCFRMRDWLDQDEFDRVEVEKDLMCDNGNICNVERGECESGISSLDEYAEIGVSKIKGKKDNVDRIKNKFKKTIEVAPKELRKIIIEEEEEPHEDEVAIKPRKVMIIEEDEDEPGSEVEMPTLNEIKPVVKSILLRNKDNLEGITFKQIMKELNAHFKVDLISMKADIKKMVKRQMDKLPNGREEPGVSEVTKGIEDMKIIEPEVGEITKDMEEMKIIEEPPKPLKSCNTISLDEDVSDEIRAQDLMCDEGEVCDLDTSKCIPEIEAIEPVEELTIGGVLLKVTGKNKIVQALKEKIYRAGGEIPVVEEPSHIREEPHEEEIKLPEDEFETKEEKTIEIPREPQGKSLSEIIEESKANDVFASNIPGKRPSLEEIVKGINSIKREIAIVSPQTKIRVAEKRCIDRIAMCAGIKLM